MYKIKLFVPNKNGKIELTVEELEDLLNKAYEDGKNDKPSLNDQTHFGYRGLEDYAIPCGVHTADKPAYGTMIGDPPGWNDHFTCSELTSTSGLKNPNSITTARNV